MVGSATAVAASVLGFFQDDAKRLLACSTAGQLGYVIVAMSASCDQAALTLLGFCCCNKAYAFVWLGSAMARVSGLSDTRLITSGVKLTVERAGLVVAAANTTIWPGAVVWHVKSSLMANAAVISVEALAWGVLALS